MEKHKASQNRIAWRPAEVAETLGVSLAFIRKEIRAKKIKIKKFGRAILILDQDLHNYIDSKDNLSNIS